MSSPARPADIANSAWIPRSDQGWQSQYLWVAGQAERVIQDCRPGQQSSGLNPDRPLVAQTNYSEGALVSTIDSIVLNRTRKSAGLKAKAGVLAAIAAAGVGMLSAAPHADASAYGCRAWGPWTVGGITLASGA